MNRFGAAVLLSLVLTALLPCGVVGGCAITPDAHGNVTISTPATTVGNSAYQFCTTLSSVAIADTVTTIQSQSFRESGIRSVSIPNSVTFIGLSSFYRSSNLRFVELGQSVRVIEAYAFSFTSIVSIVFPASTTSIGVAACSQTPLAFVDLSKTHSVTISNAAFAFNPTLATVRTPVNVTSVSPTAFPSCLGFGLSYGNASFPPYHSECLCSATVVVPSGVVSIGADGFSTCSIMTSISLPDTLLTIGVRAFQECTSLTSLTIPDSVTTLPFLDRATGLVNVTFGSFLSSVGTIHGEMIFPDSYLLASVFVPPGIPANLSTRLGRCLGFGLRLVTGNEPTGRVQCVPCDTNIVIPTGVISVAARSFLRCPARSLALGSSVHSIDAYAFSYTPQLEAVDFGSVVHIGDTSFFQSGLRSAVFPNSLQTVGRGAFANCPRLASVVLGNSITLLSRGAFANCPSLTHVEFGRSRPQLGPIAFLQLPARTIDIPANLTIAADTFQNAVCGSSAFASPVSLCNCTVGSCGPTAAPTPVSVAPTAPTAVPPPLRLPRPFPQPHAPRWLRHSRRRARAAEGTQG